MYNRYVPQPDGSYRRNRMQEQQRPTSAPIRQPSFSEKNKPVYTAESSYPTENNTMNQGGDFSSRKSRNASPHISASSFLRHLLPGDFDTEDLLVVVLLLLMAGDCEDDRNNALLTLALYLFL